ncbi:MAG: DNA mismatch repair endonuclease MutL [Bacteroidota bacterium]|nr:DNA mismatch repair endonuclease MutL [Bacteroidota bacterium]
MSDIIQLLPDSVANQIAAGEVIQRPASVIKELVENAVDAGAHQIDVLVVDAGRTSVQVIDDGKGMSETDARLSFERHATSKIRQADDLFNLHTMGFRGEALASIAAVAQVELKTRMESEELGTHLTIAGTKFMGQEPCACPVGSNFLIENLFFNVPARRKFLKSNTTELNNIISAFERIVLVYPDVAFTFYSNGSEMYNLKAGNLRRRIVDVFGKRINQDLLPVEIETSVCGLHGFVGKPESAKKKGVRQFLFVNGRYMRHPLFHKAVMMAFERLVPQGDQVPYFLYFDVDPKDIDVNIHPTKTEIKFENEQAIFQILNAAVKDAVGMFSDASAIEFDTEGKPDIPVYNPTVDSAPVPKVDFNPTYNPFDQGGNSFDFGQNIPTEHRSKIGRMPETTGDTSRSRIPNQWEQLYEGLKSENTPDHTMLFSDPTTTEKASLIDEKSPAHYQYKGRYIMTAVKSGLMIIDQHRAHVRILFEQYQQQLTARKMHAQKMLFPETIQFTPQEHILLDQIMPELQQMGFELSDLGGNTFALNAIPEGLEGIDVQRLVHEMLSGLLDKSSSAMQEINDSLALDMAKAAAIPYGQVLSNDEMENIVNSLFLCGNVNYTPDGRSVLCILKQDDIDKMLG